MAKKISELTAASSVASSDIVPVVDLGAGATKKATVSQLRGTTLADLKVCSFEQFGAVGDGVTNDTTACHAALDAVKAGTYGAVLVGPRTYLMDKYTWDGGAGNGGAILGCGLNSVIKCRGATAGLTALFFVRNVDTFVMSNLTLLGDGVTGQRGVLTGIADGTAPEHLTFQNVLFKDFATSGAHFTATPSPSTEQIQTLIGCRAEGCTTGIVMGAQLAGIGCSISNCTVGLNVGTGNLEWSGGNISDCITGVTIDPGGNDGHGVFSGVTFNHNTTAVNIGAVANGMTFSGCHFYATAMTFGANTGVIDFVGCSLRPSAAGFTFAGSLVRFLDCRSESSQSPAYNESGNPQVEFVRCVDLDGTVPNFIRDRVQMSFTFASDANDTLTKQESVAETLIVAAGVTSASRDIVSALAPAGAKSRQIRIVNNNAQSIVFKWSTGTGITVTSGSKAVIGSDGTNAILLGA